MPGAVSASGKHSGSPAMEKIKVFFATSNSGKLRELIQIFTEIFSSEYSLAGRAPRDCEETAPTFIGNAEIKADALIEELKAEDPGPSPIWVLADDSGLCVDALGGAPGIHSARYAGDHVEPGAHMQKLLRELEKSGKARPWKAHYHCALVLRIFESGKVTGRFAGEGQCFGEIVPEARGNSGFGYDPLFLFSESGLRFSELPESQKNRKSHRMAAFQALKKQLEGRIF
jgi:XTP/dITP diphosphohydrolase